MGCKHSLWKYFRDSTGDRWEPPNDSLRWTCDDITEKKERSQWRSASEEQARDRNCSPSRWTKLREWSIGRAWDVESFINYGYPRVVIQCTRPGDRLLDPECKIFNRRRSASPELEETRKESRGRSCCCANAMGMIGKKRCRVECRQAPDLRVNRSSLRGKSLRSMAPTCGT